MVADSMRTPSWSRSVRLKSRLISVLRRAIWGTDIDPTARIHPTTYIDRTWPRGVHIAADCVLEAEVVVLTHDMTRGLYLDTHVERGAIVGQRSIIMPGVRLGAGCRVAPGSVVVKDVPAGASVCGNPARTGDIQSA